MTAERRRDAGRASPTALTDGGTLRQRLASMLDHHIDHADECAPDDPALQDHLTAAAQLNAALARVDAGTYGTCRRCHEAIGAPRLEAVPAAVLCIDCQQRPRPFLI
jgi:RNA polymerase-binding transcription factor DksA